MSVLTDSVYSSGMCVGQISSVFLNYVFTLYPWLPPTLSRQG